MTDTVVMTDSIETWMVFAGVGIPLLVAAISVWWKVESGQNTEISALQKCNHEDHTEIRKEIAGSVETFTEQNNHLRDKIQEIWEHLVKEKRN